MSAASRTRVGDDNSYGAALNFPNEPWSGEFNFKRSAQNFSPALGFVNRHGHPAVRRHGQISRAIRGPRQFPAHGRNSTPRHVVITNLVERMQIRRDQCAPGPQYYDRARTTISTRRCATSYERLADRFRLPDGVVVPAGEYELDEFRPHMQISREPAGSVHFDVICCELLQRQHAGAVRSNSASGRAKITNSNVNYDRTFIRLPAGKSTSMSPRSSGIDEFHARHAVRPAGAVRQHQPATSASSAAIAGSSGPAARSSLPWDNRLSFPGPISSSKPRRYRSGFRAPSGFEHLTVQRPSEQRHSQRNDRSYRKQKSVGEQSHPLEQSGRKIPFGETRE